MRFHQDMVKRRKRRYEMVGAPRNPFEAAAEKTLAQSTRNANVTNVHYARLNPHITNSILTRLYMDNLDIDKIADSIVVKS